MVSQSRIWDDKKTVGLEVMAEGVSTGTHLEGWRGRIPECRSCNAKTAGAKRSQQATETQCNVTQLLRLADTDCARNSSHSCSAGSLSCSSSSTHSANCLALDYIDTTTAKNMLLTEVAAPASEVEAVVRSQRTWPPPRLWLLTSMIILNILGWLQQNDVKMTSLYQRPACGHVRWGRSASQSTASNASAVLIGRKKSREYLI